MPIPLGSTAVNPQTGHRVILTQQGWVDAGSQSMPLPEADAKAMETLQADAQQKAWLAQKAQQFIQTMGNGKNSFATGPGYGQVGIPHVAENLNPFPTIVGAMDPRMGALESITNQAWIHMRPEGSGAIRGYEAKDFKSAFPSVEHWGPENQQINARMQQDAALAAQKLQFIDSFIRGGKGDFAAANAAWQQGGAGMGAAPVAAPPGQPSGQPPQQGAVPQRMRWTPGGGLQPILGP